MPDQREQQQQMIQNQVYNLPIGLDSASQIMNIQQQYYLMAAAQNNQALQQTQQLQMGNIPYQVQQNIMAANQSQAIHQQGLAQGMGPQGLQIMGPQSIVNIAAAAQVGLGMNQPIYPNHFVSHQLLAMQKGPSINGMQGQNQGPSNGPNYQPDFRNNNMSQQTGGYNQGFNGHNNANSITNQGNGGNQNTYYTSNQEKRELIFDSELRKTLDELRVDDSYEINGIKLKMPHINLSNILDYKDFLENETPKRKLEFLLKTLYNTKQIKKTLDIRKFQDLKQKGVLKHFEDHPDHLIMKKINIRRLKLRIKKRYLQSKTESDYCKFKCPVYLCKNKYKNEELLCDHYKSAHQDLVQLGLKLRMSKKTRQELKKKREEEKANQILLDGGALNKNKKTTKKMQEQKKQEIQDNVQQNNSDKEYYSSSCSSSSDDEKKKSQQNELNENDNKYSEISNYNKRMSDGIDADPFIESGQRRFQQMLKNGSNNNIFGYKNQSKIDDFEDDSDLEDLMELEKKEIQRRKFREEQQKQRRQQNKDHRYGQNTNGDILKNQFLDDQQSQDYNQEFSEQMYLDSLQINDNAQNLSNTSISDITLKQLQALIAKKKEKRKSQMRAKISNKLIDQLFIVSQVNKGYIKQTLQKECLKQMMGIDESDENCQDSDDEILWLQNNLKQEKSNSLQIDQYTSYLNKQNQNSQGQRLNKKHAINQMNIGHPNT